MRLQSFMIRFYLYIFFAASCLATTAAAEKSINFSGTWAINPKETTVNQTSPEIRKFSISMGSVTPSGSEANHPQASPQNTLPKSLEAVTLQILQTENEIQTIRQFSDSGQERPVIQKFKFDGSQCLNVASSGQGEFASRSSWKNNKLIHSGSLTAFQREQRVEYYVKEEYSLSKNGKKLTIKTTATGPYGVTTTKQVYTRRDQ
jgi:hypothetical protein